MARPRYQMHENTVDGCKKLSISSRQIRPTPTSGLSVVYFTPGNYSLVKRMLRVLCAGYIFSSAVDSSIRPLYEFDDS
ncbi:MAG: hypothetical protein MUO26_13370 [Methanotrichaceae archaeon]|nr:hypothetical protein [Methanotrichaceae archaeon]